MSPIEPMFVVDRDDVLGDRRVDPRGALEASRVDLLEMIEAGIPEREFVPGTSGMIPAGKRILVAAERKTGKSLGLGVVAAVDIALAGGVAVVLDRENGAEEYARRLESVLVARRISPANRERIGHNFRYHGWPQLRLEWGADPSYPQAFADADVVIFDSSRKMLTAVGLTEDASDDYSRFTDALIDPLSRAGIATVILDNTGHADKERARGTSAKEDLVDVVYVLRLGSGFSLGRTGSLELTCKVSRLGEIEGTWILELGGGTYGSWRRRDGTDVRKAFQEACLTILAEGPAGRDTLLKAIRERGVKGREATLREWLGELAADDASPIIHGPSGYTLDPNLGPSPGPGRSTPPPEPGPRTPPYRGPGPALVPASGPGLPACCCHDGGQDPIDGRCQRCFGQTENNTAITVADPIAQTPQHGTDDAPIRALGASPPKRPGTSA